ncbi:hypothetical protein, partial [Xenorhabdus indica]|uniref:hypothetical protein n=1 Tax=Xenorhabdus indica TaxID=333964 RepID=UPI001CA421D0
SPSFCFFVCGKSKFAKIGLSFFDTPTILKRHLEKHYISLMKGYLKFLHLMSGSVGFKEKLSIKLLVVIQM